MIFYALIGRSLSECMCEHKKLYLHFMNSYNKETESETEYLLIPSTSEKTQFLQASVKITTGRCDNMCCIHVLIYKMGE
jgi:hypothetical protein